MLNRDFDRLRIPVLAVLLCEFLMIGATPVQAEPKALLDVPTDATRTAAAAQVRKSITDQALTDVVNNYAPRGTTVTLQEVTIHAPAKRSVLAPYLYGRPYEVAVDVKIKYPQEGWYLRTDASGQVIHEMDASGHSLVRFPARFHEIRDVTKGYRVKVHATEYEADMLQPGWRK